MARCGQLWHGLRVERVCVGAEPPGAQPCPQEPSAVGGGAAALAPAQPRAEVEPAALQPVPNGLCRPERLHLLPGGLPPEPLRARLGRNEPHQKEPGVQKPHTRQFAVWCRSKGGGHSSRGRSLLQEASDVFRGAGLFFWGCFVGAPCEQGEGLGQASAGKLCQQTASSKLGPF